MLSGDTVILRPKEQPEKGKPPKERVLHIAGISAPRMGSMNREDEVSRHLHRGSLQLTA